MRTSVKANRKAAGNFGVILSPKELFSTIDDMTMDVGLLDDALFDIIWFVINDIGSSVSLVLDNAIDDLQIKNEIFDTLNDYIGNNYA